MYDNNTNFNFISKENGAIVINASSEEKNFKASNVLSKSQSSFWLSCSHLPQYIIIDLRKMKLRPKNKFFSFFGVLCLKAKTSLPKEIRLYFSGNNRKYYLMGTVEMDFVTGMQLFRINRNINDHGVKKVNYIKIEVRKTYGALHTYINNIYFFEDLSNEAFFINKNDYNNKDISYIDESDEESFFNINSNTKGRKIIYPQYQLREENLLKESTQAISYSTYKPKEIDQCEIKNDYYMIDLDNKIKDLNNTIEKIKNDSIYNNIKLSSIPKLKTYNSFGIIPIKHKQNEPQYNYEYKIKEIEEKMSKIQSNLNEIKSMILYLSNEYNIKSDYSNEENSSLIDRIEESINTKLNGLSNVIQNEIYSNLIQPSIEQFNAKIQKNIKDLKYQIRRISTSPPPSPYNKICILSKALYEKLHLKKKLLDELFIGNIKSN